MIQRPGHVALGEPAVRLFPQREADERMQRVVLDHVGGIETAGGAHAPLAYGEGLVGAAAAGVIAQTKSTMTQRRKCIIGARRCIV